MVPGFVRRWLAAILLVSFSWSHLPALGMQSAEFQVVVCNVENLFDVDGTALFDDYKPEVYKPGHLLTKLQNHAKILAMVNEGAVVIII